MSPNRLTLPLASLLVLLGSAAPAQAGDDDGAVETTDPDDPWAETVQIPKPVRAFPWFFGFGAGVGYPTIENPLVQKGGMAAPAFTLHGGYTVGDHLNIGLELSAVETDVGRNTTSELFKVGYTPQGGCTNCTAKPPGADVIATSLVFSTFGARLEYAPFDRDGLFLGGTAGLAFMVGLAPQSGVGLTGRIGYRIRATNILTLSIEGGVQGQLYGDTQMYMPFGVAVVRPYF
jgi:hypothetical protein